MESILRIATTRCASATPQQKLNAMRTEISLKQQAVRDTQLFNEHLNGKAAAIQRAIDETEAAIRAEECEIEMVRKRILVAQPPETSSRDESKQQAAPSIGALEQTATRAQEALTAAEADHAAAVEALRRLTGYKAQLESDVEAQLRRNKESAKELRRAERDVSRRCATAREIVRVVLALERDLAQAQQETVELTSEARCLDKSSQRIRNKIHSYERELRELTESRKASKQLAFEENEVNTHREGWIEQLRSENQQLMAQLLQQCGGASGEEEEDDDIEELRPEDPSIAAAAKVKKDDPATAVQANLYNELDALLRSIDGKEQRGKSA